MLNGDGDADEKVWVRRKKWIYDVGKRTFPWHLPLKQQHLKVKVEFWQQMTQEFPFAWSEDIVDDYVSQRTRI